MPLGKTPSPPSTRRPTRYSPRPSTAAPTRGAVPPSTPDSPSSTGAGEKPSRVYAGHPARDAGHLLQAVTGTVPARRPVEPVPGADLFGQAPASRPQMRKRSRTANQELQVVEHDWGPVAELAYEAVPAGGGPAKGAQPSGPYARWRASSIHVPGAVEHPAGLRADGKGEVERSFGGVNGKGTEKGSRPVRQPIVINQDVRRRTMAFGENRVQLIGRLGDDVAINQLQSGGRVANMSIATDESYIDKSRVS